MTGARLGGVVAALGDREGKPMITKTRAAAVLAGAAALCSLGLSVAQATSSIPPNTLHGCVAGSSRTLEHVYSKPTSGTTCPTGEFQVVWPNGPDNNDPGFANPMTTAGDLITGGTAGAPQRLGIGSKGQVLEVTTPLPNEIPTPAWVDPTPITAGGNPACGTPNNQPCPPNVLAVVVASNSSPGSLGGGATVYCPGSHPYALGGGGQVNEDKPLETSDPVNTSNGVPIGWEVSYPGATDSNAVITAYAICSR